MGSELVQEFDIAFHSYVRDDADARAAAAAKLSGLSLEQLIEPEFDLTPMIAAVCSGACSILKPDQQPVAGARVVRLPGKKALMVDEELPGGDVVIRLALAAKDHPTAKAMLEGMHRCLKHAASKSAMKFWLYGAAP
jgi:hypothetical protein